MEQEWDIAMNNGKERTINMDKIECTNCGEEVARADIRRLTEDLESGQKQGDLICIWCCDRCEDALGRVYPTFSEIMEDDECLYPNTGIHNSDCKHLGSGVWDFGQTDQH